MKRNLLAAALAVTAGALPSVAAAQDAPALQPYIGLLGGRESFDSEPNKAGIPAVKGNFGGVAELVGGINFNLSNAFVIGAEGSIAKGVQGTIDWQYGAFGRIGVRAGQDSMFFAKVGRRWTKFDVPNAATYDGMSYGFGVEWSAVDMGADPSSSLGRIKARFQADTFGKFRSIRPMAGIVASF